MPIPRNSPKEPLCLSDRKCLRPIRVYRPSQGIRYVLCTCCSPGTQNADRSCIVFHITYFICLFNLFWIILFTCSNETGVKSLLSTPTSYCIGKSYPAVKRLFPCYICSYAHARTVATYSRKHLHNRGTDSGSGRFSACQPLCAFAWLSIQTYWCTLA